VPLGESPQEKELLRIVERGLDEHDLEFEEIVVGRVHRIGSQPILQRDLTK